MNPQKVIYSGFRLLRVRFSEFGPILVRLSDFEKLPAQRRPKAYLYYIIFGDRFT